MSKVVPSTDKATKRWMHTSGGNHLSKRRRIAKMKKAALIFDMRPSVSCPNCRYRFKA